MVFGSIDLKTMQAEHAYNVVPPTSRSTNYVALRYCDYPSEIAVREASSVIEILSHSILNSAPLSRAHRWKKITYSLSRLMYNMKINADSLHYLIQS